MRAPLSTPPACSRSSICLRILCDTPSTNTLDCGGGGEARQSHIESKPRLPYCSGKQRQRWGWDRRGRATHLDKVVAEGEEGVEGADAEIRDVELRGAGVEGQARRAFQTIPARG